MRNDFLNDKHKKSFMIAYSTINQLASSQGLYSRMLSDMIEDDWNMLYQICVDTIFSDSLDFILWVEC